MTDKELLINAAKALGYGEHAETHASTKWNPLADDGDAQRLMSRLNINVSYRENLNGKWVVAERNDIMFCPEPFEPDPYAATRRAIVRAAASIGAAIGGAK